MSLTHRNSDTPDGSAIDPMHTVFSKNRERLIGHDAVIDFFNQIVEQAQEQELLSGEHLSVDGTPIQAWAGHKSFVRKDRKDDDGTDAGNLTRLRSLGQIRLQGQM